MLILWKCAMVAHQQRQQVNLDEARLVSDRTIVRRLGMAKLLLVTFLWAALCSAPTFVLAVHFPFLYAQDPVSVMWAKRGYPLQFGS